ncbi:unnamed protein product [Parascedosporium putredinis]|uniref:Uncharacterized protein n=1 Tax=Parascedosporium putredinis TaxID=1442378 RepID=A0A9P1GUE7_9PEZI|nr:unnamed protein product [Parascedosporium putredinis]CAI7987275.1 unnamed protein product [Parascedosporium putredinis]
MAAPSSKPASSKPQNPQGSHDNCSAVAKPQYSQGSYHSCSVMAKPQYSQGSYHSCSVIHTRNNTVTEPYSIRADDPAAISSSLLPWFETSEPYAQAFKCGIMVTKSKLKLALAYDKGVDFAQVKEKRRLKALRKVKGKDQSTQSEVETQTALDEHGEDGWEDEDSEGSAVEPSLDIERLDDSDTSDSEVEMEERLPRPPKKITQTKPKANTKSSKKTANSEAMVTKDHGGRPDPHTRLTINNTTALLASLNRIRIPVDSSALFATHQSIISSTRTADDIPNVSDDLQRELQFYKQSRDAVLRARAMLLKEGVPFTRPNDFGKQVQIAKLQERQKAKKDSLEKIKALKRSVFPSYPGHPPKAQYFP